MRELAKGFEHSTVDPKWYDFWESTGAFRADPASTRPAFSMVLPPPNVTGVLHIGHALNQTLPDIVARWKRMTGHDVLWLPGTDHAGIATQNVVEKQLAEEGTNRHDLGREAFEARVREWSRQSHGTITSQMRTLGSSVDWSRERFTLDDDLSRAVRRVFVTLYREGLIYRGNYIVNWCTRCRTALSDLEVAYDEQQGKLYHIRYPAVEGDQVVTVATTRPETMLGDTAVAVNPEDDRYCDIVGQTLRLPIIGRELPVVADGFVDKAFGTGAVKVTPAHDPNDFEIGQRHDLPQVAVIDEDGRMTAEAGPYAGQDRFAARRAVVEQLEAEGLLEKVADHTHQVGHCSRCHTVVEPLVSTQWFVRIKPLAEPAIAAVEDGRTRFVPDNWARTYFEWMTNIHDWCISRQLWWGHRVPAWYCVECGEVLVDEETPARCACGGALRQDTDVLDTWFSSGLWPFSTMGWPDQTADLARYYPTTVMITGLDIIFFWVARMMMLGLKFTGDVPFETVYITSLVRDAHGQKMSKSKGNVVNPLQVMDDIGADAFRFTLAALASPGMDISLSEGRLRGYRQFVNKIWNASRFVLMNLPESLTERPAVPSSGELETIHRWILHRVSELAGEVTRALESYRFDVAADRLYHFFWHEYADWYIELVKPHLQADGVERDRAIAVLLTVHDHVLRLLHPFMPFVTEELWQTLPQDPDDGLTPDGQARTITRAAFPQERPAWADDGAVVVLELVQEIITTVRTARAELGVAPSRKLTLLIDGASADDRELIDAHADYVRRLAGLESFAFVDTIERDSDTVRRVVRPMHLNLPLAGIIDKAAETARVRRELDKIVGRLRSLDGKLGNPKFRERAAPDVVDEAVAQQEAARLRRRQLEQILTELTP
ncbi:MAG: valine--tRNA ligase [Vicinamibacterales bacterium]|jgi:valyl-tRNA synthetase|nr:valine--tRNA ligase [Vicinamibacterales bacterium]